MDDLRYGFGKNWDEFVRKKLSDDVVAESMRHMQGFLRRDSLAGLSFLDIGCGSGIHSLAALRLGAERIVSFDYDRESVATTQKVRDWAKAAGDWTIKEGSALDRPFLEALPKFDVVYSWGVLHHTGAMWDAVRNAAIPLAPEGEFYIALYSSDIYIDPPPEFWLRLKRAYNRADALTKALMELKFVWQQHIRPEIEAGRAPLRALENYGARGMTAVTDAKDWLGGYPMEFAGFRETRDFCARELDLDLVNVATGEGCTEYLFARRGNARWRRLESARVRRPLRGRFAPGGGFAYAAALPEEVADADRPESQRRSRLMLYEDGAPLGIAHSVHDAIRRLGGGRFSHWGDALVFSASDNSDPNVNGRAYSYCAVY